MLEAALVSTMTFSLAVALALTASLTISQGPAKPDGNPSPGLSISREPGGSGVQTLPVRISGDSTASTIPLYVKNTGKTDLTDLRFFAQVTDDTGQLVSGPRVALQIKSATATEKGITLPAGKELLATLEVTQFNDVGKFSGWLLAEGAGATIRLASLSLERFPLPQLKLVGTAPGAGITLTRKVAAFRHKFLIESTNRAPVKALEVLVSPLLGPDAAQVETSWTLGGQAHSNTKRRSRASPPWSSKSLPRWRSRVRTTVPSP